MLVNTPYMEQMGSKRYTNKCSRDRRTFQVAGPQQHRKMFPEVRRIHQWCQHIHNMPTTSNSLMFNQVPGGRCHWNCQHHVVFFPWIGMDLLFSIWIQLSLHFNWTTKRRKHCGIPREVLVVPFLFSHRTLGKIPSKYPLVIWHSDGKSPLLTG